MARKMHTSHILLLQMFVSHFAPRKLVLTPADEFSVLREIDNHRPQTLHRFRVSIQDVEQRIPSMRCSAIARQA